MDFGLWSKVFLCTEHPKGDESRSARCAWDRAGLGRGRPRYPYNAGSAIFVDRIVKVNANHALLDFRVRRFLGTWSSGRPQEQYSMMLEAQVGT